MLLADKERNEKQNELEPKNLKECYGLRRLQKRPRRKDGQNLRVLEQRQSFRGCLLLESLGLA